MAKEVRIWRIEAGDNLREIEQTSLDLESRLEVWLERDISILSDDLLVIARQEQTDFGGFVDLLCIDRFGDLVVVELKRDKTPREVTAQVLDYASWVRDLSHDDVRRIANSYLEESSNELLGGAFERRFGEPVPAVLNGAHSLIVVASEIDPSSERIIRYLSDEHGVKINAATFHYFRDEDGSEHVARVFLLEPEEVEQRSARRGTGKRRAAPSFEEYEEEAEQNGVGHLYRRLLNGLRAHLTSYAMITMVGFYVKTEEGLRAMFGVYPSQSSGETGLHYTVYLWRLAALLDVTIEDVEAHLPSNPEPWKYVSTADEDASGFAGAFRSEEDVDRFSSLFG